MGSTKSDGGDGRRSSSPWTVADAVRAVPPSPEALMAEIDSAIAIFEYNCSTSLLNKEQQQQQHDARLADEAFKSGCAAFAAGKLEDALISLRISLSLCPPDKTSAITKLRSLISVVSQQQRQGSTTSSFR